jgi:hypothetical protein
MRSYLSEIAKTTALAVVLSSISWSTRAQDKPLVMFSYADTSCGAWSRSAGSAAGRAQYVSWFRGFVSGHNFGNPENQVQLGQMPDEETLYLYVDKYCRENPLSPFVSAAYKLVEELRPLSSGPTKKPKR